MRASQTTPVAKANGLKTQSLLKQAALGSNAEMQPPSGGLATFSLVIYRRAFKEQLA